MVSLASTHHKKSMILLMTAILHHLRLCITYTNVNQLIPAFYTHQYSINL